MARRVPLAARLVREANRQSSQVSQRTNSHSASCAKRPPRTNVLRARREHAVWAAMYGATVTLSDPTPPTLSAPSGALWGPGEAGGFHKGTESVTVSADDVGGGVASIVLSADGRPVETYTAPCNFTFAQPCPSSTGTQTLTLPTTQLSDGTHTLTLVATDAAGNQSTVASHEITVENSAPPPPVGLSATATQAGGSTFTATWSDPTGQLAPITGAFYQVCPASGSGPCSAPASAPATGPATVTVPGPGSWSIAVWLTNAAGNASSANAAHTNVVAPPSSSGGSGTGMGHSSDSDHADDPRHGDAARARADRACERTRDGSGPRELHGSAWGQNRRLGRKDRRAQARQADRDLQARSAHGSARPDPRQREARSRARGHEHAPSSPITSRRDEAITSPCLPGLVSIWTAAHEQSNSSPRWDQSASPRASRIDSMTARSLGRPAAALECRMVSADATGTTMPVPGTVSGVAVVMISS